MLSIAFMPVSYTHLDVYKRQQIGCNDIGFVLLPDGRTYSIAVFVKDSEENSQANSKIIADISRIVYEYVIQH